MTNRPTLLSPKAAAVLGLCLLGLGPKAAAQDGEGVKDPIGDELVVLLVRPGDAAATEERAAEFLAAFEKLLGEELPMARGKDVRVRLVNRTEGLREFIRASGADLVFTPASVFVSDLRDPPIEGDEPGEPSEARLHARPIGEVQRFGASGERYFVAVAKDSESQSLDDLEGLELATPKTISQDWLRHVVLPLGKRAPEFLRVRTCENLSDEVFELVEGGGDEVPDGLLFDLETRKLLEDDDFVWPELRVVWESEPVPQGLLLTVGEGFRDDVGENLRLQLQALLDCEDGQELTAQMKADGLVELDRERLEATIDRHDRSKAADARERNGEGGDARR
ncbi:MAG: PhnD/SsuA/transferrin family substrate-binding protein [Planctomycetota bacterium]